MTLRVAVVGGGIIGLASAAELVRMGAEVRLYEKAAPASAQSQGLTRIFRYAHADPRMVSLAIRARESWRALEARSSRRLIGDEGLLITGGEIVREWQAGLSTAGASHQLLSREEASARLPIACLSDEPVLFDPSAGATRVRRAVDILLGDVGNALVREQVRGIDVRNGSATVHASGGSWNCDEVLITAGTDTKTLAQSLDLDVQSDNFYHSRFTFEIRPEHRDATLACWIDERGIGPGYRSYCQPVGTTGRYAVGVGWEGEDPSVDPATETRLSREAAIAYVTEALPGVDPEPVEWIQCYSPDFGLSANGDGFLARRRDRVTAFYGANLFKFAPLIGELLARTALDSSLPPELTMLATS